MILTYNLPRKVDFTKEIARVSKKGVYDRKQRKWLLTLYQHILQKNWKEFAEMWDSAPTCKKQECSYQEYVGAEVLKFINDIVYDKPAHIEVTL
jgi:hypothetical protein